MPTPTIPADASPTFRRFDVSGQAPAITYPALQLRGAFDDVRLAVRLDGFGGAFTIPLTDAEWTYTLYGLGQPFSFVGSRSALEEEVKARGALSVTDWLQKQPVVGVKLAVSSLTNERPGEYEVVQEGTVDSRRVGFDTDRFAIECRDASAVLWEQVLLGVTQGATTRSMLNELLESGSIPFRTIASVSDGGGTFEIGTVFGQGEHDKGTPLGILDPTNATHGHFMLRNGMRAWDMLQYIAAIDNVLAFIHKGVLWYMKEEILNRFCGQFNLIQGLNLTRAELEQSPFQSRDTVLVMIVSNPHLPDAGTIYIKCDRFDQLPTITRNFSDIRKDRTKRIITRLIRRDVDLTDSDTIIRLIERARYEYAQIVQSELTFNCTFAGHAAADLFNRYVIDGTGDPIIDGSVLTPRSITHTVGQRTGWTTHLCAFKALEQTSGETPEIPAPGTPPVQVPTTGGDPFTPKIPQSDGVPPLHF